MLAELRVRDLALIQEISVVLGPRFNALSGETGAGKSMVISSIQLLLGGKGHPSLIRKGAEEVRVEGLIRVENEENLHELEKILEKPLEEKTIILKRTYDLQGKSRYFINGELVLARRLKQVGALLFDLHGQHEYQSLIHPDTQLRILDTFGKLSQKSSAFSQGYRRLQILLQRREELRQGREERKKLHELYRFQIEELEASGVKEGEVDALEKELQLLKKSEKIKGALERGYLDLYETESSVLVRLRDLATALEELAFLNEKFEHLCQTLNDSILRLEDTAFALRDLKEEACFDPHRMEEVFARLHLLRQLSQKYGATEREMLGHLEFLKKEVQKVQGFSKEEETLSQEIEHLSAQLLRLGKELDQHRGKAGKRLSRLIEKELKELNIPAARFSVSLQPLHRTEEQEEILQNASPWGLSSVELLLSTNPGEDLQPLSRIASGGEMARIMLALKGKLAREDRIPILVFDEVDANIGGRMGKVVGQKLSLLSREHQVLCVTHLPQIACFAQKHFKVEKEESQGRTVIKVIELQGEERVKEIAEMIKGKGATETTLHQAREMLEEASPLEKIPSS